MSDYSETQRTKNAAYRDAYAEWVAKLSPTCHEVVDSTTVISNRPKETL